MKTAFSLTFDGDVVKAVVPRELAQEIIKVQAAENTDFASACRIVAERAESGSDKFKKDVKNEARRLHNSELMRQMNNARGSMRTTGYNAGYQAGKTASEIWYYCKVCNQRIVMSPNNNDHKAMIKLMNDAGWGHAACYPPQ